MLAQDFPTIRYKVDRLLLGPPVGWPLQMRVVGPERDEVRRIAGQVEDVFRQDPRLGAIHTDWLEPVTTMKLVIDQARARALGVSSQRIRQTVQASLSGVPLADIRDGEETISIVLRQPESERKLLSGGGVRPMSRPTSAARFRSRRSPASSRCWSPASNGGATACRPSRCARRFPTTCRPTTSPPRSTRSSRRCVRS